MATGVARGGDTALKKTDFAHAMSRLAVGSWPAAFSSMSLGVQATLKTWVFIWYLFANLPRPLPTD